MTDTSPSAPPSNPPPSDPPPPNKDRLIGLAEKLVEQSTEAVNLLSSLVLVKTVGERRTNNWLTLRRVFFATIAIGAVVAYLLFYAHMLGFQSDPLSRAVAVVTIQGEIAPGTQASADRVIPVLQRACAASHVDSILLIINSGGGSPSEAERMTSAIDACKQGVDGHPPRRVVALIDSVGASAAYMIAMHADKIYAGRYSLVGSIGAIMRLNDLSTVADRLGVKEHDYRTAPLKGGPSMITGPTEADAAEFQGLVDKMGRQFLAEVVKERGKRLKLTPEQLFTGQVWTSQQALAFGLIDGLADREDLERTLYKGQKLHDYSTKDAPASWLGFSDMVSRTVRKTLTDLQTPTIR